ncbi:NAD-dependent epimerase/dehydratase family protein [Nitrosomonas sp.]|uniref:NAD-dependent epimerase/dehydratase family protein n=1 Tax=Nitrosomonas sp. TaxID=42353 RepID=UPI002638B155|nr:NAD-dependent epimerase/dehydratase family protein [Nitrosomonas sp.]
MLVTGANGFVGQMLCPMLEETGFRVVRAVRAPTNPQEISVGDVNEKTDWSTALTADVNSVVHLAGQLSSGEKGSETADSCYQVNTLGTIHLARECAAKGVSRFVFVSTVKVLGEGQDEPYQVDDLAVPDDAYAISKWEAEQSLWQISAETRMEVVILRPPLVYGPGVKGNFFRLLQAMDRGMPLPLGAIHNRRSLIYLGNLVDAIRLCLSHPGAAGKTFMLSDGEDVSTPELLRRIAAALDRKPLLVPVPVSWIKWVGSISGRQAAVARLTGSLAVDGTPIRQALDWQPPWSMQAGLALTAQWYHKLRNL